MDTESPAPAPAVPAGIDESTQSSRVRGWARVVTCCTAALLCLTVLRVAQLKLFPSEKLDTAAGRRTSVRPELAQRGGIVDQRGRPMAVSLVGWRLFCDPALA